jgi:integrase
VLKAVKEARELRRRIDRGEDPLADRRKQEAASRDTLEAVCGEYFQREGGKLRSRQERERTIKRLVLPVRGRKDVRTITRGDIVRLLDAIEDGSGPVMATRTLAYLGRVLSWFESRNDDFRSPVVRGMGRSNAKERARQRVLSDDELRAVWKAAAASTSPYSRLVRFILLTGSRRDEAASMPWEELDGGTWTLPAARNKTKQDLLRPLSKQALAVLPAQSGVKFKPQMRSGTFGAVRLGIQAQQLRERPAQLVASCYGPS